MNKNLMIVESKASEVYDAPYSLNYNVVSKFDGSNHIVHAYTSDIFVSDGWICFDVKNKKRRTRSIGRPFHFLSGDGILLSFKQFRHYRTNSFALNHELFSLDWDSSVILHFIDGIPKVFIASRQEWLESGRIGTLGEELQVFLEIPQYRMMPNVFRQFDWWVDECAIFSQNPR